MLDLNLDGVEEALANLRRVIAPVNGDTISDHAVAALEPVAADARRLAPKDTHELADSIVVSKTVRGVNGNVRRNGNVFVGPIGSEVEHAWFMEVGTVHMRAQPYLAPAIHENRELVFDILGSNIGNDMLTAI